MAGKDNLIVPTSEQARENGRKGGLASAKAKKRRKELKQIVELALNTNVPSQKTQKLLTDLGFDPDFQSAIVFKVIELATKGNLKAVEMIFDVINKKDGIDISEQKERIKALKLENKKRERLLNETNGIETSLFEYFDKLEGVLKNGDK